MSNNKNKIIGVISRILFKNEENGYHVLSVDSGKDLNISVTINQPHLYERVTYEFEGEWTMHPKFGHQFKATIAFEVQPTTKEGLIAYLQSDFFNGIGPVIAHRIVNHFGENVIEILNNDSEKLLEVNGISKNKLKAIQESWEKNKEINEVMMFLQQYEISALYATKILEFYGKNCVEQVLSNPYKLSKDIEGIGFSYADKIALKVGFAEDSPERIRASINHILEQGTLEGHCYLLESQIATRSTELLKSDVKSKVTEFLHSLEKTNEIKSVSLPDEEKRYYSRKIFFNESYCSEKIHTLAENEIFVTVNDKLLQDNDEIQLSEEQTDAVKGVIGHGISILTGGPGTGKSTILKKILNVLSITGKTVSLCAPTGRAAQRITQTTGKEASTIHRLLSWDHINGGFLKNENNPIESDFIICDETSMVDINLAAALLRAVKSDSQILFVGDINQLFPVGPGNFFKDLIESEVIKTFKLNKIFRQGKNSLIIKYAHDINNGNVPIIESPIENPELWKNGTDCLFIDSGCSELGKDKKNYPSWSSLRYGFDLTDMIIKLYVDIIPKYLGKEKEIQILIPMNVSDIGTIKINQLIQERINPHEKGKKEIKIKEKIFRVNDKVIQTKNNYDLEVFNGDIGKIISIDDTKNELVIKFSEEKEISYKKSDILELDLSYAISIHKSQGSEFDCVIIPVMLQYYRMLERRIYYTGITRGKKLSVFIGQRNALDTAVKTKNSKDRQTSLKEFLLNPSIFNCFI